MPLGRSMFRAASILLLLMTVMAGTGDPSAAFVARGLADDGRSGADELIDPRTAVLSGIRKEQSRQWLDAIHHYEAALKRWPENDKLQYGLRRSKVHFGIERRYADNSFEAALLPMSRQEALNRFDEVYDHVRRHYVDPISPTVFVAHGTESLYMALGNERFVKRHLAGMSEDRIQRLRDTLRERYWNKPVSHPSAARSTVAEVCDLAASTVGLPTGAVVMEYIFGGCNSLDDYSNYLTPDRINDLYGNIRGEFVGLGIEMKAEPGSGMLLVNILPGSPAEEGGLQRGDCIVSVESTDCRDLSTDEAAKLLRGPAGSSVRLRIRAPDGQVRVATFVRRAVHIKSIPVAKIVDRENGIAYVQMSSFQTSSASELDDALESLKRQGMRSLIWDLRGNPGGLLTSAVEVLDRFIEEGVLVSTGGRNSDQNLTYSARRPGTWKMPLVLLVDGDSASASEIVAGAIHDHRRGTVVGRQTFGKWSVQSIFDIDPHLRSSGSATGLRLTTARFYSPRGKTLGKVGVKPDLVVELAEAERQTFFRGPSEVSVDTDADLRQGVEVLRRQLTQR